MSRFDSEFEEVVEDEGGGGADWENYDEGGDDYYAEDGGGEDYYEEAAENYGDSEVIVEEVGEEEEGEEEVADEEEEVVVEEEGEAEAVAEEEAGAVVAEEEVVGDDEEEVVEEELTPQQQQQKPASRLKCPNCASTNIHAIDLSMICSDCGVVVEESAIVADVEFIEGAGGASTTVGQFVSATSSKAFSRAGGIPGGFSTNSRENTIKKARRLIKDIANILRLDTSFVDTAERYYKLAIDSVNNFVRGRKKKLVVATCLYVACREKKTQHMLIDFSDALQVNVYILGNCFLKFRRLHGLQLEIIDPALYVSRFTAHLELDKKARAVALTALRLIGRMNRDWILTGRRPAGICAAALLISARAHGFSKHHNDVTKILKVCGLTVNKRVKEFEQTSSATLTLEQFDAVEGHRDKLITNSIGEANNEKEENNTFFIKAGIDDPTTEADPPSFTRNKILEARAKAIQENNFPLLTSGILDDPMLSGTRAASWRNITKPLSDKELKFHNFYQSLEKDLLSPRKTPPDKTIQQAEPQPLLIEEEGRRKDDETQQQSQEEKLLEEKDSLSNGKEEASKYKGQQSIEAAEPLKEKEPLKPQSKEKGSSNETGQLKKKEQSNNKEHPNDLGQLKKKQQPAETEQSRKQEKPKEKGQLQTEKETLEEEQIQVESEEKGGSQQQDHQQRQQHHGREEQATENQQQEQTQCQGEQEEKNGKGSNATNDSGSRSVDSNISVAVVDVNDAANNNSHEGNRNVLDGNTNTHDNSENVKMDTMGKIVNVDTNGTANKDIDELNMNNRSDGNDSSNNNNNSKDVTTSVTADTIVTNNSNVNEDDCSSNIAAADTNIVATATIAESVSTTAAADTTTATTATTNDTDTPSISITTANANGIPSSKNVDISDADGDSINKNSLDIVDINNIREESDDKTPASTPSKKDVVVNAIKGKNSSSANNINISEEEKVAGGNDDESGQDSFNNYPFKSISGKTKNLEASDSVADDVVLDTNSDATSNLHLATKKVHFSNGAADEDGNDTRKQLVVYDNKNNQLVSPWYKKAYPKANSGKKLVLPNFAMEEEKQISTMPLKSMINLEDWKEALKSSESNNENSTTYNAYAKLEKEVDDMFCTDEEMALKEAIFNKVNKDFIKHVTEKENEKKQENAALTQQELDDMEQAEGYARYQNKNGRKRKYDGDASGDDKATTKQALLDAVSSRKISRKINYDAMSSIFDDAGDFSTAADGDDGALDGTNGDDVADGDPFESDDIFI